MELSLDCKDGGILSIEAHRSVPAPFLTKTYDLVEDPSTDEIVSWGEDRTTFVVWRPSEFAKDILPNYFKHNNFSSFVRQLNTYGFRKIVSDRWEFSNEFFLKGNQHQLSEIVRRKAGQNTSLILSSDREMDYATLPAGLPSPHTNMVTTRVDAAMSTCDENQGLRMENFWLSSEITRMRQLYNQIINFVERHVDPNFFSAMKINHQITLSSPVQGSYSSITKNREIDKHNSRISGEKSNVDGIDYRHHLPISEESTSMRMKRQCVKSIRTEASSSNCSSLSFLNENAMDECPIVLTKTVELFPLPDNKPKTPKLFGVSLLGNKTTRDERTPCHFTETFPLTGTKTNSIRTLPDLNSLSNDHV